MLCNKIIKKIFLGLFIIPFLISSAPKSSQLFIFRSFENGQYVYYKSDIYNPSKTQKLDTPPCNTNPRYFTPSWSLNGKHYVCSTLVDQPLFIKDSNNVITAKLEPGDPNDSILWSFGSWSPNSQYITVNGKHSEDLFIMKYDGANFLQLVRSSNAAVGQSQWSPNGKYIAYQYFPFANDNDYLTTIDTTGRETHRFDLQKLTNGASPYGFNWSPDSKKLTFLGSSYLDDGWYILDIESGRISSVILKGSSADGIFLNGHQMGSSF